MTRIEGLLKTRSRLITVVGPAGVGKTRLALEVARAHGSPLATLELSSARSIDDLCRLLGRALSVGLAEEPDAAAAVERIGDALAALALVSPNGHPLVVLDELERLVPSCSAALAGWAARAGSIRFLITSRVALGIADETVYELLPLRLPAAGEQPTTSPAVRLFLDRLPGARDREAFAAEELTDVAAIVERLEGVPLAIELAAATLASCSASQLRASLERAIAGEGSEERSEDRRSLRGAILSAWDALDAGERDALVACAVFRGGFTIEALAAVLELDAAAAQARADRLRARSLLFPVEVEAGLASRLDVYDSVRRFVLGLGDPGRLTALRERHDSYFLGSFCDWRRAADLQAAALSRLEADQANLLAVLERALAAPPSSAAGTKALQVVVALGHLRIGRAPLADYLQQLDAAMALADGAEIEPPLLVLAAIARGRVHSLGGRLTAALVDHQRAFELADQRCGDEWIAQAAVKLAMVHGNLGEFEVSARLFERAIALGKRTGQQGIEAEAAGGLARVSRDMGAAPETAIGLAEHAIELARRAGDMATAARMEARLGTLLADLGRHDDAAHHFEAGRAIAAEHGLTHVEQVVALNLAVMAHDRGELEAADSAYRACIERTRELGLGTLQAGALALRGFLLLAMERVNDAASSFALALRAFEGGKEAPYAGLTHVALGVTHAAADRVADAERCASIGHAILERGGMATLIGAADVLGAHLDLAAARAALARGDQAAATRARESAAERVARARSAGSGARSLAATAHIVRFALATVKPALARAASGAAAITIARDASFVRLPGGVSVDLRAQPLSRRILLSLLAAHRDAPGVVMARDALVRAVWPGEELPRLVGKNRLHVAVNQLRGLGLRALVLSRDGGFLLDPDVALIEVEP